MPSARSPARFSLVHPGQIFLGCNGLNEIANTSGEVEGTPNLSEAMRPTKWGGGIFIRPRPVSHIMHQSLCHVPLTVLIVFPPPLKCSPVRPY